MGNTAQIPARFNGARVQSGRAVHFGEAWLRHPLMVGALIALFSGLLASLVIPAATRVWQDRPKELALKQAMVAEVSRLATGTIELGDDLINGDYSDQRVKSAVTRAVHDWNRESAVVASELDTYFNDSPLANEWRGYEEAMPLLLFSARASTLGDVDYESTLYEALANRFRGVRFDDPVAKELRRNYVNNASARHMESSANLLRAWRDEIVERIVESHAAGFSRGFWILR
jgi:hypothetical protein